MNVVKAWLAIEANRGYIYRSLVAIGGLLSLYGLVTSDQLVALLGVATAVLNIMPSANTSTKGN